MLFPTRKIADSCRVFMLARAAIERPETPVAVRLVQFFIAPTAASGSRDSSVDLHIVLFPAAAFPLAKQFWQHTGLGISSRVAEHCLAMLAEESRPTSPTLSSARIPAKRGLGNRHYAKKPSFSTTPPPSTPSAEPAVADDLSTDHVAYLEERYGRNLPAEAAAFAKRALRRRIAGVLVHDSPNDWSQAGEQGVELGPSTRGVKEVSEEDVFLYPTGMSAIFNAHQLALGTRPLAKSICFG